MLFSSPDPAGRSLPLTQFLEELPPLPTTVKVFNAAIGSVDLLLASLDRNTLIGYGPQSLMEDGLDLVVELRDGNGSGQDVLLEVTRSFYQVDGQTMLYLNVIGSQSRAGQREVARAPLDGAAFASVVWSARLPVGDEVHVRLADVSPTTIAFLSELVPVPGDELLLTISIGDRPVTVEARVRRVDPAPLARYRVAADIKFLHDWDRAAVERLAETGHPMIENDAERRPELHEARAQSRAEQHQLQARLAIRRYAQQPPAETA